MCVYPFRCAALAALLSAILICSTSCQSKRPDEAMPARSVVDAPVSAAERGRYLVATSGCNDCHTPFKLGERGPEPDMSRMLSGHPEFAKLPPAPAAQGPWI